jgi:hypothetical protein
MVDHPMARPWLDWIEMQDQTPPDDGTPVLVALPLDDGDALYVAAFVDADGTLEPLNGGEIGFTPSMWATIPAPVRD